VLIFFSFVLVTTNHIDQEKEAEIPNCLLHGVLLTL
jgi:hypothetical protein